MFISLPFAEKYIHALWAYPETASWNLFSMGSLVMGLAFSCGHCEGPYLPVYLFFILFLIFFCLKVYLVMNGDISLLFPHLLIFFFFFSPPLGWKEFCWLVLFLLKVSLVMSKAIPNALEHLYVGSQSVPRCSRGSGWLGTERRLAGSHSVHWFKRALWVFSWSHPRKPNWLTWLKLKVDCWAPLQQRCLAVKRLFVYTVY